MLILLVTETGLETVPVFVDITQTIVFGTARGVRGDEQGFALFWSHANAHALIQPWAGFCSFIGQRWGSRFLNCLAGGFRFNDVTVGIDDRLGGCGVDLVAVGIDHEAARVRVVVAGEYDVDVEVVNDRPQTITNAVGGARGRVAGHTVQRAVEG